MFFPVIPEKLSEIESFSGITGKVYLKLFKISASTL
jgi:hypothetical protein